MKVPYSLLSIREREDWIDVPASPTEPALGIGRVRLRALAPLAFEDIWAEGACAEKEAERLAARATASPGDVGAKKHANAARALLREKHEAIIAACVVDHDPASFTSDFPAGTDPDFIRSFLEAAGYLPDEIATALKPPHVAAKRFSKSAPEMTRFYELCQPYGTFLRTLLLCIHRYQNGDMPTPQDYWPKAAVTPEASADDPTGQGE